jgi:hypothetical protein
VKKAVRKAVGTAATKAKRGAGKAVAAVQSAAAAVLESFAATASALVPTGGDRLEGEAAPTTRTKGREGEVAPTTRSKGRGDGPPEAVGT